MRVNVINLNCAVVQTSSLDILFSYNTPVAAMIGGVGCVRTKHSVTTSKHINTWLRGWDTLPVYDVPQDFMEALVRGVAWHPACLGSNTILAREQLDRLPAKLLVAIDVLQGAR